ncbi:hypothetical protein GCM10028806_34500 [Spirosoma terrae]|uniref:Uncharacterized protein n=1 Tax=Spirosoma terrae TaxID=1968276 RepID=A0A6L9L5K2_9BACT|nr:hypothetical protein [Spirosoma terrae]NDU95764.1 hypothetical protein [Spirosoma terrae]
MRTNIATPMFNADADLLGGGAATQTMTPPASSVNVNPPVNPGKLKLPETKTIQGYLLNAEIIDAKNNTEIVLLTVQDAHNKVHTISSSPGYWTRVGKAFKEDDVVEVSYEKRIAHVTGYHKGGDENTPLTAHESDGSNLASIKRFSKSAFERMLLAQDEDRLVGRVEATEDSKALAVATLLGGLYGRR